MKKIFVQMILILGVDAALQQQYFRVEPKHTRAQEGAEVTLQCEIDNLTGRVQWTKDGFALGYLASIPGFPRYTMIGDSHHGVYNLRIQNVSLEDDAEFECQVGPSLGHPPHKAIRSTANLTVLSPPVSIEMVGHGPNAKVEIKESEDLSLECLVRKSKPVAKIVWYRGSSELKLDNREDKVTEWNEHRNPRAKLYDVSSRIRLKPTSEDDYINYTCEAQHDALPSDMALRATIQLSVLYPPGPPYIEGYSKGETLRRGQNVELVCRSRGGNPPAQLVWYKNGEQIRAIYRSYGRMSENVYAFTAEMNDNNARYTCEASSTVGPSQIKAETNLTVYYAPVHVSIFGTTEAKVDETVHLNCTTGASNPAAQIRWLVDGRQVHNTTSKTEIAPENGWITTSTISVQIPTNKTGIVIICHGVNAQLAENVVATHTINVLYPPGQPTITGYERGSYIKSGSVQKLVCKSTGGNPLASMTWYKNDKKVNSFTKTDKTSITSEISILSNASDNEAVYKCEATNPATDIPLFESVKFKVYFPPDNVIIKKEPKELRAGIMAKLICDASSSNPEADLSWWREGIPVTEGTKKFSKPGLNGGRVASIELSLSISEDMDGNVYTCQAANSAVERSIHTDTTLSVLYKPAFLELNETVFRGVEGESLTIPLQATGHPTSITYTWVKNGIPLVKGPYHMIDGPVLNFTKLSRQDTGIYTCEAINSEGSAIINFTVVVHYATSIAGISSTVLADDGEDAELWCTVDGRPLNAEHVSWRRPGFRFERTVNAFRNATSYLTVRGVTKADMGQFACVADNGLGNESSQFAYLVVKHKPEGDPSPVFLKAASNIGETGRLICRASGAPKLSFSWSKDGYTISINTTAKYYAHFNQLDPITYESVLSVRNVEIKDFGNYKCTIRNTGGTISSNIRLSAPSPPDPPISMSVVNATHDSVTIIWTPGFDGGETTKYKIRYGEADSSKHNFKHVEADSNTSFTIGGLQLGTTYLFTVMAYNRLGASSYLNEMLKATTSSEAPPSLPSLSISNGSRRISLVVGGIVVAAIVIANVLLVVFCILKKSKKQIAGGPEVLQVEGEFPLIFIFAVAVIAVLLLLLNICILTAFFYRRKKTRVNNEHGGNKSGTIEMYAPSSFNETMTGETLSSVSEKSETYSDPRHEYDDEKHKNGGSAYMIEQIDYPFQYPGYDTHPKENGSIGHHRNPYASHNGSGYHSETSSRYSSAADPRYVTYPPPIQFAAGPIPPPTGTLRRGVPPPDVTVSVPPMTTFNYGAEAEGHLV